MDELNTVIIFLAGLLVSAVVIYIVTKLFGENKGLGRAIMTALIGTIVYTASYYLIETGWIAAIVAGFAWLIALGSLYKIGFLKSIVIAFVIWICATVIGVLLPTVSGPL